MRRYLIAALIVLGALALPTVSIADPSPAPPPAIVALVQRFLDAANANDPSKFAGMFTDDAVVIDEDTPFVWTGPDAGTKWWHSVQRKMSKTPHATLHATGLAVTEYRHDREGDDAYMIQPLRIDVTVNGKTMSESGAETFTFHEANGAWKISTATWTTKP